MPVMTLVGLSLMIGSLALFHFTQVFPWRRPWIRAYWRWLLAGYLAVPVALAAPLWAFGPFIAEMTSVSSAGAGGLGAVSVGLPESLVLLLIALPALFVLGLVVLVIFQFSLALVPEDAPRFGAGILWVAIVFASVLALGRTFLIERENSCIEGLLTSPLDRGTIFLAKLAANVILLVLFECLLLPVFSLMFGVSLVANPAALVAVTLGGTVGLAAVGTLFALAALGTRAREMVLPLLVLPLEIPLVIAAVQSTQQVLAGASLGSLGMAGQLLVGFDVLVVVAGWMLFEFVLVD
jgi:heme exporter protein B